MIIDAWIQHPTLRFLNHDMFAPLRRWTGQELPGHEIPIEATVAALDAAEIGLGLLSAWHAPREGALISNDEVAGWVAEHPARFAGLAAVDLARPVEAVRELRRCVTELGFKGLRMLPWIWEVPPTDRRFYPLFAACVELGVPFCTQVGHTAGAGPLHAEHERCQEGHVRDHYPMIAPQQARADLDALGLSEPSRELFLGENARRVFGLG